MRSAQVAFMFVTVTYYTIVKSSVPLWVLLFSVLLGLQRPSLALGVVVLSIVVGIGLASVSPDEAAAELSLLTLGGNATANATAHGSSFEAAAEHAARRLVPQWSDDVISLHHNPKSFFFWSVQRSCPYREECRTRQCYVWRPLISSPVYHLQHPFVFCN